MSKYKNCEVWAVKAERALQQFRNIVYELECAVNQSRDEIERLRTLRLNASWDAMKRAEERQAEIDRLRAEIERLRELLKGVVDDMVIGDDWEHLLSQIEKEVGDEWGRTKSSV